MDTLITVAQIATAVVAGAVVALHVIAPITKTQRDDDALTWLQWLETQLRKVIPLPSPPVQRIEAEKLDEKLDA